MSEAKRWNVSSLLCSEHETRPVALIILNQPLFRENDLFPQLWERAALKLCADGGGNSLFDAFQQDENRRKRYIPDRIRGDLDSLRPEVGEYYKAAGCAVEYVDDQDSTDFMKCLNYLRDQEQEMNHMHDVIAIGALGGRFDQTMASINQLFSLHSDRRIILMSKDSIAFLLTEGEHEITIDRTLEGPTCGIIPIGGPAICSTAGLKWNLDSTPTYFGGLVSSSNAFEDGSDVIRITTDKPLIWTTELHGKS